MRKNPANAGLSRPFGLRSAGALQMRKGCDPVVAKAKSPGETGKEGKRRDEGEMVVKERQRKEKFGC